MRVKFSGYNLSSFFIWQEILLTLRNGTKEEMYVG